MTITNNQQTKELKTAERVLAFAFPKQSQRASQRRRTGYGVKREGGPGRPMNMPKI